jgi:hypothetical protein
MNKHMLHPKSGVIKDLKALGAAYKAASFAATVVAEPVITPPVVISKPVVTYTGDHDPNGVRLVVPVKPAQPKRHRTVTTKKIMKSSAALRAEMAALYLCGGLSIRPNKAQAAREFGTNYRAVEVELRALEGATFESPFDRIYRESSPIAREIFFDAHPDECLAAIDRATKPTSKTI